MNFKNDKKFKNQEDNFNVNTYLQYQGKIDQWQNESKTQIIKLLLKVFFCFVCDPGVWTQGFTLVSQFLYCLSHSTNGFLDQTFERYVSFMTSSVKALIKTQ
jgi:hypothetical protein